MKARSGLLGLVVVLSGAFVIAQCGSSDEEVAPVSTAGAGGGTAGGAPGVGGTAGVQPGVGGNGGARAGGTGVGGGTVTDASVGGGSPGTGGAATNCGDLGERCCAGQTCSSVRTPRR